MLWIMNSMADDAGTKAPDRGSSLDIGERLRKLRLQRRMSQRGLAKRSGISNATISQIESGKANPSVAVLKSILVTLKMDLAEFFAEEADGSDQVIFRASELLEIGRGKVSYRQVGRRLEGRAIQILHECYAPGAATGKVALKHTGEEGGIVISGQLELILGDVRHLLGPGDAYYFKSTSPHQFRNIGTEECVVVSACSPPSV